MRRERATYIFLLAAMLAVAGCGGSNRDFENSADASPGGDAKPDISSEASSDGGRLDAALDGPCTNGASCTPANPCHEGQATCSGSQLVLCADTQRSRGNGSPCG